MEIGLPVIVAERSSQYHNCVLIHCNSISFCVFVRLSKAIWLPLTVTLAEVIIWKKTRTVLHGESGWYSSHHSRLSIPILYKHCMWAAAFQLISLWLQGFPIRKLSSLINSCQHVAWSRGLQIDGSLTIPCYLKQSFFFPLVFTIK